MKSILTIAALLVLSLNSFAYDGTKIKVSDITDSHVEKILEQAGFYHNLHVGGNPLKFVEVTDIEKDLSAARVLGGLDKRNIHLTRKVSFYDHRSEQTHNCDVYLKISKMSKVQNLADVEVSNCQLAFRYTRLEVTLILNGKH